MNNDDVKSATGTSVTESQLNQARAVVEAFIGKMEPELSGKDLEWFERMVAWQSAYMTENDIFTTANAESIRQDDSTVRFNKDYSISPLVITATRHLSWKVGIGQVRMSPWISHKPLPEWYTW